MTELSTGSGRLIHASRRPACFSTGRPEALRERRVFQPARVLLKKGEVLKGHLFAMNTAAWRVFTDGPHAASIALSARSCVAKIARLASINNAQRLLEKKSGLVERQSTMERKSGNIFEKNYGAKNESLIPGGSET